MFAQLTRDGGRQVHVGQCLLDAVEDAFVRSHADEMLPEFELCDVLHGNVLLIRGLAELFEGEADVGQ